MSTNYLALYAKWDTAMAAERPDFASIYAEMLEYVDRLALRTDPATADFWWRMSNVAFALSLNYDIDSQLHLIEEKITEAVDYADKAIHFAPTCFEANLAKARAIDRSGFFACSYEKKVNCIHQLFRALGVCSTTNPEQADNEPLISFLMANVLSLLYSTDEAELVTMLMLNEMTRALLPLQPDVLEEKLRRSVELMPNCSEAYIALVTLLTKQMKYQEAREMAAKGVAAPKLTKWDQGMGRMLEMARVYIADL